MAQADYYFSTRVLQGVGRMYFLKVLQEAPPGSGSRRLLGSFVDEGDKGILIRKTFPYPRHVYTPEIVIARIAAAGICPSPADVIISTPLAGAKQSLSIDKTAGADLKGDFPGAPLNAAVEIDYKKLKTVTIELGAGAQVLYIPDGYIEELYRSLNKQTSGAPAVFFDDDRMIVNSIMLIQNMTVTVESDAEFKADFEAKATGASNPAAGVSYQRKSKTSYALVMSGTTDYLFGVGGLEATKYL